MRMAADMRRWCGRSDDDEGPLGRRWHQVVQPMDAQSDGIALVGFACDAGVVRNHGRAGAQDGPAALRTMLGNLPVRGCNRIVDAGDVACTSDDGLESAQDMLADTLAGVLARGPFPITLGGGHEVAWASFQGLARHLAPKGQRTTPRIGVVNLDAHLDLRIAPRASSGTPFRQIGEDCAARGWPFRYFCLGVSEFANTRALFARAQALGATWRRDDEMDALRLSETLAQLDAFMAGVDHLYLTLCLDVLPAPVAPGVSAPAARGVPLGVVEAVIDHIAASPKLRLADIAELNPRLDIDGRTARVAARLVGRLAEGVTATRAARDVRRAA